MEAVVATGAISRARLQSNHHHQQTNICNSISNPERLPPDTWGKPGLADDECENSSQNVTSNKPTPSFLYRPGCPSCCRTNIWREMWNNRLVKQKPETESNYVCWVDVQWWCSCRPAVLQSGESQRSCLLQYDPRLCQGLLHSLYLTTHITP